jgi:nitrite reductase/ring-hydroxylating ferredoxin subunit
MRFHILSLLLSVATSIIFPSPLSTTKGWHPVAFDHEYMLCGSPKRVEFIDEKFVLWKGKDDYFMRPDVCPHQGSKLSEGKIENNCITCPYHGLSIGPTSEGHSKCREVSGKCIVQQGIVWWSSNKREDLNLIPLCDKLENNPNTPISRFSTLIKGSFSDCFKNGMDFHHAAFVHKNTFGNYAGEPELIAERWNVKGELEGNFMYGSNNVYAQYTGGTTHNSHVYCEPSTTYNIVEGKEGKYMVIHVAMRSITPSETMWYVTAASNFVPSGPVGRAILDRMAKKVAIEEDGVQLSRMATDKEKLRHSFKFTLPLDTIYAGWNKKYESAEQLEKQLLVETNTDYMAIIAEKLRAFNHTIEMFPLLKNTQWDMFNCPHLFPGSQISEIFYDDTAEETTTMKNGTSFRVNGSLSVVYGNQILLDDLTGYRKQDANSEPTIVKKLPFTKHAFEIFYISNRFFLRKGVETATWEILRHL